jgi:hypothetical protein
MLSGVPVGAGSMHGEAGDAFEYNLNNFNDHDS